MAGRVRGTGFGRDPVLGRGRPAGSQPSAEELDVRGRAAILGRRSTRTVLPAGTSTDSAGPGASVPRRVTRAWTVLVPGLPRYRLTDVPDAPPCGHSHAPEGVQEAVRATWSDPIEPHQRHDHHEHGAERHQRLAASRPRATRLTGPPASSSPTARRATTRSRAPPRSCAGRLAVAHLDGPAGRKEARRPAERDVGRLRAPLERPVVVVLRPREDRAVRRGSVPSPGTSRAGRPAPAAIARSRRIGARDDLLVRGLGLGRRRQDRRGVPVDREARRGQVDVDLRVQRVERGLQRAPRSTTYRIPNDARSAPRGGSSPPGSRPASGRDRRVRGPTADGPRRARSRRPGR